jgi:hypothetical protein
MDILLTSQAVSGGGINQFSTRLQRLLIPTILPIGLDAHQIITEREHYPEALIHK